MKSLLEIHQDLLRNQQVEAEEELQQFLSRYEKTVTAASPRSSLSYALDLTSMQYAYVSPNCGIFTGKTVEDFKSKGMDLLLEIMPADDFKALSNDLFPAMQQVYLDLPVQDRKEIVFELYYRLINTNTGIETPVVEYSNYARYDDEGTPTFSTGVIYESPLCIDGVRGIVRHTHSDAQETLFDRCDLHAVNKLTKTEKAIVDAFIKYQSRNCIAKALNISIHTVRTHFKNIYKKLDINKESDLLKLFKV